MLVYQYKFDVFSYIQYSAVCARALRRCLKSSVSKEAMKREESFVRVSKWQDGKLSDQVYPASKLMFWNIYFFDQLDCVFIFRSGTNLIEFILLFINMNYIRIA